MRDEGANKTDNCLGCGQEGLEGGLESSSSVFSRNTIQNSLSTKTVSAHVPLLHLSMCTQTHFVLRRKDWNSPLSPVLIKIVILVISCLSLHLVYIEVTDNVAIMLFQFSLGEPLSTCLLSFQSPASGLQRLFEGEPWWSWRKSVSAGSVKQLSELLSPRSQKNGDRSERMQAFPAMGCGWDPTSSVGYQQKVCALLFVFLINWISLQHLCGCSCMYRCMCVCMGVCMCV